MLTRIRAYLDKNDNWITNLIGIAAFSLGALPPAFIIIILASKSALGFAQFFNLSFAITAPVIIGCLCLGYFGFPLAVLNAEADIRRDIREMRAEGRSRMFILVITFWQAGRSISGVWWNTISPLQQLKRLINPSRQSK